MIDYVECGADIQQGEEGDPTAVDGRIYISDRTLRVADSVEWCFLKLD